jgi:hypothetical protein
MAWPFLAGIIEYLILSAIPGGGGGAFDTLSAGLYGLFGRLVSGFGLALALIAADSVWRYGRAPLGETWETGTRKIGDLFFAALGFTFVVSLASIVGSFLGPLVTIALVLAAFYFFVYTIPAAAIGGVPGGAALNTSLERARDNPGPTLPVAILYYLVLTWAPQAVVLALSPLLLTSDIFTNPVVGSLVVVVVTTILRGYLAFVMAKTYTDLAFGRRRW